MIDSNILAFLESQAFITSVIPAANIYNGKPQNQDDIGDGYIYFNVRNTQLELCDEEYVVDIYVFHQDRSTVLTLSDQINRLFRNNNQVLGGQYFWRVESLGLVKSIDKLEGGFYWANMIIQLSLTP